MTEPTLPPSPDDSDEGWGEPAYEEESVDDAAARRLREERPPHHDRD
ncbi:MAG TPA: hypothetical protein VNA14_06060 [Mycobacteriales bacterium]|nr:hypothetical protein [Mycobacteriales bacterium]